MKTTTTMIFIALFAVGCSSTSSQTPVESALDQIDDVEESEATGSLDRSDDEVLTLADRYEGHEDLHADIAASGVADDATGEERAAAAAGDESGGASDSSDADDVAEVIESEDMSERLLEAVARFGDFGDREIVTLAHFRRGARNVVVVWPAVTSTGTLAGSAVYGVCVEEQSDGSFESCGERWRVNDVIASSAALTGALGGADYEVVRNQSSSLLDELGSQLMDRGNAFVAAAGERDGDALFRAAQDFMAMLPVADVAFDNSLAQLLVTAARSQRSFEHLKTETGDLLAAIFCKLQGDWHEVTTMHLTAEQVDGDSGEWRIVDFW